MDALPLNFAILRNPLNWIIVFVILFIGGLIGHYVTALYSNKETV